MAAACPQRRWGWEDILEAAHVVGQILVLAAAVREGSLRPSAALLLAHCAAAVDAAAATGWEPAQPHSEVQMEDLSAASEGGCCCTHMPQVGREGVLPLPTAAASRRLRKVGWPEVDGSTDASAPVGQVGLVAAASQDGQEADHTWEGGLLSCHYLTAGRQARHHLQELGTGA